MSRENENRSRLPLIIPKIRAESETQTSGHLISRSPQKPINFEMEEQNLSIKKRRNLSKNRAQATRYREKTPEPGRTPVPHEDTTSDDEDKPLRNSREIEADKTYEEMRRLVQEKVLEKDPVYDLDTDEVLGARAIAANEKRRRSISPFALPDDTVKLERRGSFVDPTNKLLSALYNVSPKDEDRSRRSSLTIEPPPERRNSLSPPGSASTIDKEFPYLIPTTPKKLEKMVYPDEQIHNLKFKEPSSPITKENVFSFDEKQTLKTPKAPETPSVPGELVTKVIQIERSPSRRIIAETKTPETPPMSSEQNIKNTQVERSSSLKVAQEAKPNVEVRERIVRTPSRKMSEVKPIIVRRQPEKPVSDAPKLPPVKPARSKSATRFGGKTSESDVSEDQIHQPYMTTMNRRKVMPTPRRFQRNRSPRANRSQSVNRVEDIKIVDRTGTGISETSKEIIELMQKARARSLSIPKDDRKVPSQYKTYKTLQTPNKTPSETPKRTRGISCPKTIQIISDTEILSGLAKKQIDRKEHENSSRQSSGYIDASQSEYTSSCYSTSPSENDFDFDLSERAAELTHKLHLLNEEINKKETRSNIVLADVDFGKKHHKEKSRLRKRTVSATKNEEIKQPEKLIKEKPENDRKKPQAQSRFQIIANWQQFKTDNKSDYEKFILLRNRCFCDLLLLIFMFGMGGMMFKSLEGSFENVYKCSTRNVKRDFIEALWRGSHHLREDDWKSLARKKLFEFEEQLHTAHEAGVTSYSGQRSWNFMNSFVYCMSLVSTIGYGYIAPKTTYGRVATIVYAIIGIPLFLIVLADFGKLFTRIIKFFWSFIRRFYYTRSCRKVRSTARVQEVMKGLNIAYNVVRRPSQMFSEEDMGIDHPNQEPPAFRRPSDIPPPLPPKPTLKEDFKERDNETEPPETPAPSVFEIDDEFNLPISVAIFVLVVYIIIGALAYSLWETWNFFESFYFVFISMSTIGLGDIVPDHPVFMMSSILYLVFGLALTSMCINVVQIKLSDTFRMASAKLGATIGLKVAEEDGSLTTTPSTQPVEEVPVHKPKKEEKFDNEEAKDL